MPTTLPTEQGYFILAESLAPLSASPDARAVMLAVGEFLHTFASSIEHSEGWLPPVRSRIWQTSLGELIDDLKAVPNQKLPVQFDFCGLSVGGISTYVGSDNEISIDYTTFAPSTVQQFLSVLTSLTSPPETLIRAGKPGDFLTSVVTGVMICEETVLFTTEYVP